MRPGRGGSFPAKIRTGEAGRPFAGRSNQSSRLTGTEISAQKTSTSASVAIRVAVVTSLPTSTSSLRTTRLKGARITVRSRSTRARSRAVRADLIRALILASCGLRRARSRLVSSTSPPSSPPSLRIISHSWRATVWLPSSSRRLASSSTRASCKRW